MHTSARTLAVKLRIKNLLSFTHCGKCTSAPRVSPLNHRCYCSDFINGCGGLGVNYVVRVRVTLPLKMRGPVSIFRWPPWYDNIFSSRKKAKGQTLAEKRRKRSIPFRSRNRTKARKCGWEGISIVPVSKAARRFVFRQGTMKHSG